MDTIPYKPRCEENVEVNIASLSYGVIEKRQREGRQGLDWRLPRIDG